MILTDADIAAMQRLAALEVKRAKEAGWYGLTWGNLNRGAAYGKRKTTGPTLREAVLTILAEGPMRAREIAPDNGSMRQKVYDLHREGLLTKDNLGRYGLPQGASCYLRASDMPESAQGASGDVSSDAERKAGP